MQSSRCRSDDALQMLSPVGHTRGHSCVLPIGRDWRARGQPQVGVRVSSLVLRRRGMSRLGGGAFYPPWRSLARTAPLRAGQRLGANMTRIEEASFSRRFLGKRGAAIAVLAAASVLVSQTALADEGGVSLWLPGFFGSLAASPLQPGWSLTSIYYHTSVSAGADVARAREITIGRIPATLNVNLSASLHARADLALAMPLYTFATPVLGGQATVGVLGLYGRTSTSLAATLSGTLSTPLGTLPFARSDTISDAVTGFGDVLPLATLRWNNGVHNVMTYMMGDVAVGAYDSTRLSNIGIGHGAIDAGAGYTYLNPQTGHEFSGVLGFTYNFTNQ